MALPAQMLERLAPALSRGIGFGARELSSEEPAPKRLTGLSLSRGLYQGPSGGSQASRGLVAGIDAGLPDGGLLRGGVVEIAVRGASALATSVALAACRAAQEEGLELGLDAAWCAFLDPSGTLYAPGAREAGVRLERLLVVRPSQAVLGRTALRVVESRAFSVVVIDALGSPGERLQIDFGAWVRVIRRLALAVEGTTSSVLLLTDAQARRPLPLPVAQRIELRRRSREILELEVMKDRRGRLGGPRRIPCTDLFDTERLRRSA